jgi:hypothetical protein
MNLGLGEDLIFGIVSWSECYSSCIECELLKTWMPMNEVVGGIYSPQPLPSCCQRLLAMGAPDSPVADHCPVRAMSAQPLGFGAVDRWRHLLSCCTGQSSDLWLLRSDFCHGTVHLTKRPLAHREPLLRWLTVQSSGTSDSPVNYSGARMQDSESGMFICWLATVRCTPESARCAKNQHTLCLAPIFDWVPNWISFLVSVEPYAPEIDDI